MSFSFEADINDEEKAKIKAKVRELTEIKPLRALLPLLMEWFLVFGAVALSVHYFSLWSYVLVIFFIATRQHAIGIFVHDAAHFRLVKNRRANTVLSNILCGYPLFFQMEMYRHNHLLHHTHTNNEHDPDLKVTKGQDDWNFPMSMGKILKIYGLDFLGFGAVANFKRVARYNTDPEFRKVMAPELAKSKLIRVAFYLILAIILTAFGAWKLFLLYWIAPLLWMLPAVLRLRNMSEHYGLSWETDLEGTRDILCGPVERWLLAPHGVNYHLTHHLYPSVPYFHLEELHRFLTTIPAFKQHAHYNTSYVLPKQKAVWRDWISTGRYGH